ncbi:hypothetical protein EYZ11_003613 [Aspergillus tanneri]|uniref:Uncharacterized protein n=1 Tax=Aspergillus tanneri TaxID=1220188 RepID=A0A4S3JMR6_9EURO|nr:hypothetical protein EYZ11_003613 [Aspergillus tanneri]
MARNHKSFAVLFAGSNTLNTLLAPLEEVEVVMAPDKVLDKTAVYQMAVTWGGVTIKGARDNYGVVIDPADLRVCEAEIEVLRKDIKAARDPAGKALEYDRGGTIEELRKSCLKETGLPAPSPQWELDPYGPHMQIPYVKERFLQMKEAKGWKLQ